jgi:hypothetical protein
VKRLYSIFVAGLLFCFLPLPPAQAQQGPGWKLAKDDGAIQIFKREKKDRPINEVLGKKEIDLPPWVLVNVINDVGNYKEFMPYTLKSKVVKTEGQTVYSYQFLKLPIISNRDYVLTTTNSSSVTSDGKRTYKMAWNIANEFGPPLPEDTVRVDTNQGYWLFAPRQNGKSTLVSYYLYTYPGGNIPIWVANRGNTTIIPKMFNIIAKQGQKKKYWKNKPKD